jgi:hypothetical protein
MTTENEPIGPRDYRKAWEELVEVTARRIADDRPFVFCHQCSYFSNEHGACFHPDVWTDSYPFKEPGDCKVLNANYHCRLYDGVPPVGQTRQLNAKNRVANFFRRLLRPWKIRVRRP